MDSRERAQIRTEEHLQKRGILESTASKGTLIFGVGCGIAGFMAGCENTAHLVNSIPPDLLADQIRKEAMYVIEHAESFRGIGNDLLNASYCAVAGSAVGMILGKIIDLIGRARSRIFIPGIDGDGNSDEE